jgi:hypothetical protein
MRELITIKGTQRACLYGLGVLGLLGPSPPAKSKKMTCWQTWYTFTFLMRTVWQWSADVLFLWPFLSSWWWRSKYAVSCTVLILPSLCNVVAHPFCWPFSKFYNCLLTSDATETTWTRISLFCHNFLKCLPIFLVTHKMWRCTPVLKVIRFLTREHSKLCAVLWLMATEIFHTYTWSMHVPAYPPMLLYLLQSQNFFKVCVTKTVKFFVVFYKTFSCTFQLQMPSPLEENFSIFKSYI